MVTPGLRNDTFHGAAGPGASVEEVVLIGGETQQMLIKENMLCNNKSPKASKRSSNLSDQQARLEEALCNGWLAPAAR